MTGFHFIKHILGKHFPKAVQYYLLFPGSDLTRLKNEALNDTANHLISASLSHAQHILKNPVIGLAVDPNQQHIYDIRYDKLIKINRFYKRGVYCFIGLRFLTLTLDYQNQLITKVNPKGITLFGNVDDREIHGFTLVSPGYQSVISQSDLWQTLQAITTTQTEDIIIPWQELTASQIQSLDSLGFHHSPTAQTFTKILRRYDGNALPYLNKAFSEIISNNQDSLKIDNEPDQMAKSLLSYREMSSVPWIFNTWLNAIEHRLGHSHPASLPPEIHISLTGLCNLECNFCSYTHDNSKHDFVTLEQIAKIENLKYIQILRLHSGLGEPTTNPHLSKIIDYLALNHPHINLNFFTNGLNLNRSGLIDAIVGQVQWINVSLNAATGESWQKQCNLDRFDRVQQNLQRLLTVKRSKGSLWPIVFGTMVLNKSNLYDLPLMPALCHKLGIDRFTAIPFFALGYSHPRKYGSNMTLEFCRQEYDELYWKTVQSAKEFNISIEIPLPTNQKTTRFGLEVRSIHDFAGISANPWTLKRFVSQLNFQQSDRYYCHFLWRQMAIGSTTKASQAQDETHYLYPCLGPLAKLDLSPYTGFRLGGETSILEAWNNPFFTHLRQAQQSSGICEVCDLCRQKDTRNPNEFLRIEKAIQETQETISKIYNGPS